MKKLNPQYETYKICTFIKSVLSKSGYKNVILGVSGGIDSATSLKLISLVLPPKNIFVTHLYYFDSSIKLFQESIKSMNIPQKNILLSPIMDAVDVIAHSQQAQSEKLRMGNIMARIRMIYLYDFAKKYNALVCGTENRSEKLLGYFTRFGDAASDFEPIQHLYKTQVRQLAEYLDVAEKIRSTPPSAGLWAGQTDENELGFSYEEADAVFSLYYDQKIPLHSIIKKGFPNAEKIITVSKKNAFKHEVPYDLRAED